MEAPNNKGFDWILVFGFIGALSFVNWMIQLILWAIEHVQIVVG